MNRKHRNWVAAGLMFLLSYQAQALQITNHIQGVGSKDNPVDPVFCIQNADGKVTYTLKPGETVEGNVYSGNNQYIGGALRFGGCSSDNMYLGYIGYLTNPFGGSNYVDAYNSPQGVHIKLKDPGINVVGELTGTITYTPIKPNFSLLNNLPSQNLYWEFVGINLSGLEFSKMIDPNVIPNLSEEDKDNKNSDLIETVSFLKEGLNTIRVPVSWGYLQLDGPGKGEINLKYYDAYVKPLLQTLTHAKVNTIVDLHAYMRYSQFGKEYAGCGADGKCPDGTLITDARAYELVWSKLYALIKNDKDIDQHYLLFDLINEPVEVPDDSVFTVQTQVIKRLREDGFQGYILVEGNSWSGLHSWTTYQWRGADGKIYTNASLFTRENFQKAGITDLAKIIINVHQYLDADFSGTHDNCQTDLKTTGDNGFNLNAFTDYLQQNQLKAIVTEFGGGRESQSCKIAMKSFLNYLKDNAAQNKNSGFIGWTIWSAGHGWGNYNLRVTPISYHMQVLQSYLQPLK